ncbi:MAG: class I tRNA ligase family protein, partial [Chloroflexota bacterium]
VLSLIEQSPTDADPASLDWTLADSWIWARLRQLTADVDRLFTNYQFGEAGRQIYEFFWSEFADWYLEIAKGQVYQGGARAQKTASALVRVLDTLLRFLHPYTPFVTEELWGYLKGAAESHSPELSPSGGWEEALIIARWPEPTEFEGWEEEAIQSFEKVMDIVKAIRNLRAEKNVKPGHRTAATIAAGKHTAMLQAQAATIAALTFIKTDDFTIVESLESKPEGATTAVVGSVEIFLPLSDLVDTKAETARLKADLEETKGQITRLEKLLGSPFAQKAPAEVVDKERAKLEDFKQSVEKIQTQLDELK